MKKHGFTIAFLILVIVIVVLCIHGIREDNKFRKNPPKPTIVVEKINTTPHIFFKYHEKIMMPNESVIYSKYIHYDEVGENKWLIKYEYVYIFQDDTREKSKAAYWFNRIAYLESHPKDAVDKKLIFSDNLPDPKIFIIQK